MHKLDRPYPGPSVLQKAKTEGLAWDEFHEKEEVQLALSVMQNNRCAYCESSLKIGEGHIEHFRRKNKDWFPALTFEWSNLFYSCMRNGSCGCHKDRPGVLAKDQLDLLIDPCVDNPEDFLVFTADGNVSPRSGLSEADHKRAVLTIDVFNLRHPDLKCARANEIKKYKWMIDTDLTNAEVEDCLAVTPIDQYITAVYHYLGQRVVA